MKQCATPGLYPLVKDPMSGTDRKLAAHGLPKPPTLCDFSDVRRALISLTLFPTTVFLVGGGKWGGATHLFSAL